MLLTIDERIELVKKIKTWQDALAYVALGNHRYKGRIISPEFDILGMTGELRSATIFVDDKIPIEAATMAEALAKAKAYIDKGSIMISSST